MAKANGALATAGNFTRGLIVGEPDDLVSLAGTALGDLFVFGDIRDAVREGSRIAQGQEVDHLILGLAAVGIAVTAGTYASLGVRYARAHGAVAGESRAQDRTHFHAHGGIGHALAALGGRFAARCARCSRRHR